ncbi:MAG: efflux RND transporter periplasmic adaptor subunit [Pseudomonadota bacterium]
MSAQDTRPSRNRGVLRAAGAYGVAAAVAASVAFGGAVALQALYARAEAVQGPPPRPPLPVEARVVALEDSYAVTDRFAGRIETARETDLTFERAGLVLEIAVEEGDRVAEGDLIARIDARALEAERDRLAAEKTRAETELELAIRTRSRQENLSNKGFASEQRFDEAQASETALKAQIASIEAQIRGLEIDVEKSALTAPFAGLIAARAMDPGAVAQPGRLVARLLEVGAPRARIGLPPERAAELEIGARYPLAIRGDEVEATLIALRPDLAPMTRTVDALFDLSGAVDLGAAQAADAETGAVRAPSGQIVRLARDREVAARGVWLPLAALQEGSKGLWTVYTVKADPADPNVEGDPVWRVAQEAVTPIHVHEQRVFVGGTLSDGATVIVSGVNRVARGQEVRPMLNSAPLDPADDQSAGFSADAAPARIAERNLR